MALVSSLFIIAVIGLKISLVEKMEENTRFSKFTFYGMYESGLIGLLILFPILVFPYSPLVTIFIIAIEVVWFILWGIKVVPKWIKVLSERRKKK
jgi:hypothetical protein